MLMTRIHIYRGGSTVANKRNLAILMTVGIATLLSSMTNSVTNTVLPLIAQHLHLSIGLASWVNLIYLVVLIVLLLPAGRLIDMTDRRLITAGGFGLFALASIAAALSHSLAVLLAARGITAVAGALLLSAGPAILTAAFPAEERGAALGWQALMTYFGLAVGPVFGGWLAQIAGWPAIFWMGVPLAVLGSGMALAFIPGRAVGVPKRFDPIGSVTFMAAMVSLTLIMNPSAYAGHTRDFLLVLVPVALASGFWFVRRQQRLRDPLIDLRLLRVRNYRNGTLGAMINYLCFFVALFLLPFYLSRVQSWTVGHIGIALTIMPVFMMVLAPWAGRMSDRWGARGLASVGMAANVLGLAAFALAAGWPGAADALLVVGLVCMGAGTGLFAAPNNAAIMTAAPNEKQGVAAGTLATARYVGMVAGTTLGSSVFHVLRSVVRAGSSFSAAFLWVMVIGAVFGVVGLGFTLSMERSGPVRRAA